MNIRLTLNYLIAVAVCSNILLYGYNYKLFPLAPGLSYFLVIFTCLFSYFLYKISTKRNIEQSLIVVKRNSNFKYFCLFLFALSISVFFALIWGGITELSTRFVKTYIINISLSLAFMLILQDAASISSVKIAIASVVILSVILNIYDFSNSNTAVFSSTEGRAAGLYVNPNVSAMFLVFGMILSLTTFRSKLRLLYCGAVGFGVMVTFSRGGILVWIISMYMLSAFKYLDVSRRVLIILLSLITLFLVAMQLGYVELDSQYELSKDAKMRLVYGRDDSIQGRVQLVKYGISEFLESPVFGGKLGNTSLSKARYNPENQYILLGVQQGVLGLLAYIMLIILIWKRGGGIGKVFSASFAIFSLTCHNMFDNPFLWYMILFSFAITEIDSKKGSINSLRGSVPSFDLHKNRYYDRPKLDE